MFSKASPRELVVNELVAIGAGDEAGMRGVPSVKGGCTGKHGAHL